MTSSNPFLHQLAPPPTSQTLLSSAIAHPHTPSQRHGTTPTQQQPIVLPPPPIKQITIPMTKNTLIPQPHTIYLLRIQTPTKTYSLWKRYSEFDHLNTVFESRFPFAPDTVSSPAHHGNSPHITRHLPRKRVFGKTFGHRGLVEERRKGLEAWLRGILEERPGWRRECVEWWEFLGWDGRGFGRVATAASGIHPENQAIWDREMALHRKDWHASQSNSGSTTPTTINSAFSQLSDATLSTGTQDSDSSAVSLSNLCDEDWISLYEDTRARLGHIRRLLDSKNDLVTRHQSTEAGVVLLSRVREQIGVLDGTGGDVGSEDDSADMETNDEDDPADPETSWSRRRLVNELVSELASVEVEAAEVAEQIGVPLSLDELRQSKSEDVIERFDSVRQPKDNSQSHQSLASILIKPIEQLESEEKETEEEKEEKKEKHRSRQASEAAEATTSENAQEMAHVIGRATSDAHAKDDLVKG